MITPTRLSLVRLPSSYKHRMATVEVTEETNKRAMNLDAFGKRTQAYLVSPAVRPNPTTSHRVTIFC